MKSSINKRNCVGIIKEGDPLNTKNNQRFRETETRMEVAMLELMGNTDFNKITVKKYANRQKLTVLHFMLTLPT